MPCGPQSCSFLNKNCCGEVRVVIAVEGAVDWCVLVVRCIWRGVHGVLWDGGCCRYDLSKRFASGFKIRNLGSEFEGPHLVEVHSLPCWDACTMKIMLRLYSAQDRIYT